MHRCWIRRMTVRQTDGQTNGQMAALLVSPTVGGGIINTNECLVAYWLIIFVHDFVSSDMGHIMCDK